jgi:hypothetical protein
MTPDQRFTLILFFISIICLPTLAFVIRATIKWTRVEAKLEELTKDMRDLVEAKDKVHTEIVAQMNRDREATDKRLRWLEEYLWKRGSRPNAL